MSLPTRPEDARIPPLGEGSAFLSARSVQREIVQDGQGSLMFVGGVDAARASMEELSRGIRSGVYIQRPFTSQSVADIFNKKPCK